MVNEKKLNIKTGNINQRYYFFNILFFYLLFYICFTSLYLTYFSHTVYFAVILFDSYSRMWSSIIADIAYYYLFSAFLSYFTYYFLCYPYFFIYSFLSSYSYYDFTASK